MNFLDNITFRRARTHSNDLGEQINNTLDETDFDESITYSLPDLTKQQQEDIIIKLKEQIESLQSELNSAHEEIETLSLENSNLRESNHDLMKKNDLYKTITSSPIKLPKIATPKKGYKKNKQTQTETSSPTEVESTAANEELPNKEQRSKQKRNHLCIISSNNFCNITSIAENIFPNYNLCHYLSTNCGISQLLHNLHIKLSNYTLEDYCLVFIGERDFKQSHNYSKLIVQIRETLTSLNHTNIILCLPTYKCNNFSVMYNWRIEMFNNLLYHDIQIYNYAILLDSNMNLVCDYSMFSKYNGVLNNYGMLTIFNDIKYYIATFLTNNYVEYECKVSNTDKLKSMNRSLTEGQNLFR